MTSPHRACPQRRGFTIIELLVVMAIIGLLMAILIPAVNATRESARRAQCMNNLKQIAVGLQNYVSAMGVFPPGAVLDNVGWEEPHNIRRNTEVGPQGTSWMLQILGQIDQASLLRRWDFRRNLTRNLAVGMTDIPTFYCPSRRGACRSTDQPMLFTEWTSGGTDYGGCLGRANGWRNMCSGEDGDSNSETLVNGWCAHVLLADEYLQGGQRTRPGIYLGIFGPNSQLRFQSITDGTSQTIAVGELQRFKPPPGATGYDAANISEDGWAVAGAATLFVTAVAGEGTDLGQPGGLNNRFFESAGSEHPGGANFGMADGSVLFLDDDIDQLTYSQMGSYADGAILRIPD